MMTIPHPIPTPGPLDAEGARLLPCPFCGGKASIERFGNTRVSTIYVCDDCGCRLETGEEFHHGRAWNRRVARPTPKAEAVDKPTMEVPRALPMPPYRYQQEDLSGGSAMSGSTRPAATEQGGDAGLIERLRSQKPLPVCPYDRRSPDYWTTPDDEPCKMCGFINEDGAPDLCTGADTRVMDEAAAALEAAAVQIDRLKLAICGGEDAPGAIAAVTIEDCERFCREGHAERGDWIDRATRAEAQVADLRKALEDAQNADAESNGHLRALIAKARAGLVDAGAILADIPREWLGPVLDRRISAFLQAVAEIEQQKGEVS